MVISCNQCKILKNTYFEKYLRLAASENLPLAAILIFRRNFWSSILSAFYKKCTSRGLFSIRLLIFSLKCYYLNDCITDIFELILQNLYFKNTFLRAHLRASFWYFENFTFKLLTLNKFVDLINIVGTLYFMSRNVDFVKT